MPGPENFCFLTVLPRNEAGDRQIPPARKGILENPSEVESSREDVGFVLDPPSLLQNYFLCFISRPPETLFQIRFVFGFNGGRDSLRQACNHEGTGGGRQLVRGCHPWQLLIYAIRHDFIYFEVVASILVQGGEDF